MVMFMAWVVEPRNLLAQPEKTAPVADDGMSATAAMSYGARREYPVGLGYWMK